ncbi:hypothetical protein JX265_009812 [Neoarthrinium moseri]|uniref:Apple domain-containing protein n=1 Tax=Neoarthrinium moseri TaxID=1658444 RepID=A0A9P9WFC0_9PEZI|nr:uncharacterized protein JN550_005435 [Neoarthrinium moseri]KAI1852839.1 hypothetical protein JX266_002380 [Neoarthrinium moseri]KAI1860413.1 hypothetical protein JX265_009812 [Neoarthrinium moseri]KAI1869845.1 hypothetical protein JN550_005435 [Neoarthrinium moseri]
MKPYRSSTLQGQPLIPTAFPSEIRAAKEKDLHLQQDLKSRFELLNLKSPRFSFSSFSSPSVKQPAPVQHSWLRDPTPPATPDPEDARFRGGDGRFPIPPGGKNARDRYTGGRICGLQKRWFWALIAVAAVILLGMCIGIGVGVSQSNSSSSHNAGSGVSANSTASSSTSPSTTTTTTTSTSASPTATSIGGVDCPAGNGTTYNVPGSTAKFLHLCGVDYSGDNEAKDLKNVQTDSMADCMINCAGTSGCTGCGWGYIDGDSLYEHTCWMKTDLKTGHTSDSSWAFAILL